VLGPKPHFRQHGATALGPLAGLEIGVDLERRFEDRADLLARIERCVRVLEDHLHGLAEVPLGSFARGHRVVADELQLAARRRLHQRDDARERRLAAAGLADDRQRAARREREGKPADRVQLRGLAQRTAADPVDTGDVTRFDDGRGHGFAVSRIPSRALAASRCGSPSG
jgi:hypothetical protein